MAILVIFYFFLVGVVALLAQMVLPYMFPVLDAVGLGSALIPLVVICSCLELSDERGPILATVLGVLVDLMSHDRFGTSVLILLALSTLIATQAYKPETHSWIFRLAFVLVGTFLFFVMTHLLRTAQLAHWYWPFSVWSKIVFGSLLNLLLAPIFFLVIGWPLRRLGWQPDYENHDPYGHAR